MFVVGIAGGSGAGKTTFAKLVLSKLEARERAQVAVLGQDNYYLPTLPELLYREGKPNFDHPFAFDWRLLKDHVELLKQGEAILVPSYDFQTHARVAQTERLGPVKVVLLEGIYALWDEALRNLMDLKLFLAVDSDIRFIRRFHRDIQERGRTLESVIAQYYDSVRPMHREHLEPTRQFADLCVGEDLEVAADLLTARIRYRFLHEERV